MFAFGDELRLKGGAKRERFPVFVESEVLEDDGFASDIVGNGDVASPYDRLYAFSFLRVTNYQTALVDNPPFLLFYRLLLSYLKHYRNYLILLLEV